MDATIRLRWNGSCAIDVSFCAWPRPERSGSERFRHSWLTRRLSPRFTGQPVTDVGVKSSSCSAAPSPCLAACSSRNVDAAPESSRCCIGVSWPCATARADGGPDRIPNADAVATRSTTKPATTSLRMRQPPPVGSCGRPPSDRPRIWGANYAARCPAARAGRRPDAGRLGSGGGRGVELAAQIADLVAELRGVLEAQVLGCREHLLLELHDRALELLPAHIRLAP